MVSSFCEHINSCANLPHHLLWSGVGVQTQIHFLNMNMNLNKGGWIVCSYLEYEHELELTRVSYCVYVSRPVLVCMTLLYDKTTRTSRYFSLPKQRTLPTHSGVNSWPSRSPSCQEPLLPYRHTHIVEEFESFSNCLTQLALFQTRFWRFREILLESQTHQFRCCWDVLYKVENNQKSMVKNHIRDPPSGTVSLITFEVSGKKNSGLHLYSK